VILAGYVVLCNENSSANPHRMAGNLECIFRNFRRILSESRNRKAHAESYNVLGSQISRVRFEYSVGILALIGLTLTRFEGK
jgi:hypothetical protein